MDLVITMSQDHWKDSKELEGCAGEGLSWAISIFPERNPGKNNSFHLFTLLFSDKISVPYSGVPGPNLQSTFVNPHALSSIQGLYLLIKGYL